MVATELTREFNLNGMVIPDPNPNATPEQVKDILANQYPELTNAAVKGPKPQGDKLIFDFQVAVGTKG